MQNAFFSFKPSGSNLSYVFLQHDIYIYIYNIYIYVGRGSIVYVLMCYIKVIAM